jgi:nitrogen fixation protein NifU and related proteins
VSDQDPKDSASVYQDQILNHARQPVGYMEALAGAEAFTAKNPLCGDEVTVMVLRKPDGSLKLGFHCRSCLLCKASASIMVASLTGSTLMEARDLIGRFKVAFEAPASLQADDFRGDLRAIFDLQRYPTRLSCVLLPWDAAAKLLYN